MIYTQAGMFRARLFAAAAATVLLVAAVAGWLFWQQGTVLSRLAATALGLICAATLCVLVVSVPLCGLIFEMGVRQTFRAVCRQKGLAAKVNTGNGRHRWHYPSAGRLEGNSHSFRLVVRPLHGQSLADWEKATAAFTMAYGATVTRIKSDGGGRLTLLVGYHKLESHEFEHRTLPALGVGSDWRGHLRQVEVGKIEGARPFCLPLIDSHILIAGTTGAGKGSVVWSIVLRLMPAAQAGVVRFWGFDPKRMELAIGRPCFGDRYAADIDDMIAQLEWAHDEMLARADALAGKVRKFDPSPVDPLEVLVIDELGYLVALVPDRKKREHVEKLLSALLVLGRAVGFTVIGAIQDPRKETLSFRDLFPTRVAMRLPKGMVDLVLGTGMYEAGAQCDLIPVTPEDGAGVAFVVDETATLPLLVRMSWCSDDAIREAAARLEASPALKLRAV
jgi:S-DNA-T family DNA segregation ATPase FtsK/SpoIIIE